MKNEIENEITFSRAAVLLMLQFISPTRMIRVLTEAEAQEAHRLLDLWRVED